LTNSGSGNFGGTNLATDSNPGNANNGTITIATGAATFTIKKANFNGLDTVSVGSVGLVATGSSDGFVIRGPASPNTNCSTATPCTTEFRSSNDSASTCTVEKNGPVQAVVKCNWSYNDALGNTYMRGSARFYFNALKTAVRIVPVLHNADYGPASGSASTAFKAMQSYELRTGVNLSGTTNFTFANHTGTPTTGTLSGSDSAYIYQGQSLLMGDAGWSGCGNPCTTFTLDSGYRVAKNGAILTSGSSSQYPQGWAEVSSSTSGAGVEIGTYQFAANGPKSLEFNNGGAVATIGLFAKENTFPVYQAWPQWKTDEIYLNFHSSAPPSLSNEFLKLQHALVGRAPRTQYNSAGVFFYSLEDPTEEDSYYTSVVNAANPSVPQNKGCCLQDIGTSDPSWPLFNYPGGYWWNQGGGRNQLEWRYSYLMNFITRGQTGRYLGAKQFYTSQVDMSAPHADGFNWRSKSHANASSPELDGYGMPNASSPAPSGTVNIASDGVTVTLVSGAYFAPWEAGLAFNINGANYSVGTITDPSHLVLSAGVGGPLSNASYKLQTPLGSSNLRSWSSANGPDQEHRHWWGILDYYFLTGDETVRDAVNNSQLDFFLNPDTYQNGELGGQLNGQVTTNGTAVSLSSGSNFQSSMVGNPIMINGVVYTVATVTSGTALTLTASAGTQTGASYYALGGVWNARAIGVQLAGASRYSRFLQATGDVTDAKAVLQQAANDYSVQIKPPLCVSGSPSTCSYGPANGGPWTSQGISLTRGVENTSFDAGISPCNAGDYRAEGVFQSSILMQGLWELRTVEGPAWSDYMTALDLAYGQSLWARTEGAFYDGTSSWTNNGFRYYVAVDIPNAACDSTYYPVRSNQTVWFPFFIAHQVEGSMASWQTLFNNAMQRTMSSNGIGTGTSSTAVDFGGYQLSALIDIVERPGSTALNNVPISGFTSNGAGSYTISWTVPAGAQSYRIKWGSLPIVDWIGFDPAANSFIGDPVHTMNWFAATNVSNIPAPSAAGSSQSLTINTGTVGLTAGNFSVKAYVPATTTPIVGASNLVLVSGNGQTGAATQPLPSPLVVMATDSNGNPVAGTSVSFSVASGGGTLQNIQMTTNSQGQASATWVLGPNAGANTVLASSAGLAGSPLMFTATAQISTTAANLVLVSGNGQSGNTGQQLPAAFTVEATDANGNPVSGVTVSFAVTAGGGALTVAQVQTNSQGLASTTLTLGQTAGNNSVTATSGSLTGSPVSFAATAVAPTPGATSVSWNKPILTPRWPTASGYMQMNWDPVSSKAIIYGHQAFAGTVSVTNGSSVVTWISGDKFGDFWQATDRITIGSTTYNIAASPSTPVSPPSTNNKTTLTLTTNYLGATGIVAYSAAETTIYSNDLLFYDAGTNTWAWGPGTGAQQDLCIVDAPSMPGQRHPMGQMTVDTLRGFLWLTGGINQSCTMQVVSTDGSATLVGASGTNFVVGSNWKGVTACVGTSASNCINYTVDHVVDQKTLVMTSNVPAGQTFFRILAPERKNPSPNSIYDTYYLKLNSDPTTDTWTQVATANNVPDAIVESAMIYDPDDDVIVLFGYDQGADVHDTFLYCSTLGNPGATLTAKQTAAGCARADDWTEVTTSCFGSLCARNHPPGSAYPSMVWDSATHKILQYGGTQGYAGTPQNVIFAYDVPAKSWVQKTTINLPPPGFWNGSCCLQSEQTIAYNSQTQKLFYHYLNNNTSADYLYDPMADAWSLIGSPSAGVGATATNGASGQMATYDPVHNMIIGWNQGGPADLWLGSISGNLGVTPANACDLNGDGSVNSLDVQIAINQVLGIATCGNADLIGNGACSIVDVQRIVNASLGGGCKTGN